MRGKEWDEIDTKGRRRVKKAKERRQGKMCIRDSDDNVCEGHEVKGLRRFTLTRGDVAVYDGEIRTQEGHGKFVSREANTPVNKALSQWKEITNPRPVQRTGIPATGV